MRIIKEDENMRNCDITHTTKATSDSTKVDDPVAVELPALIFPRRGSEQECS